MSRLLDPKITYVQLPVLEMLFGTSIGLSARMCFYVCLCETDHDSKNLYAVLVNLAGVS